MEEELEANCRFAWDADDGTKLQSFYANVVQRYSHWFLANWLISNKCGVADLVCSHRLDSVCFLNSPWALEVVNTR